jgi:O-methyltransferase
MCGSVNRQIVPGVTVRILNKAVIALSMPILLQEYFRPETGREYQIGFWAKLKLAMRMAANRKRITTASHFLEHLMMATQVLKVPKAVEGCVVECGTFKGGSAANLSLVCALCDRKLEIFDSFQGLPEPSASDREHVLLSAQELHTYAEGAWKGTLEEVKGNVARCGKIEVCTFNVGYFEETLPHFGKPCVLAFLDVDLIDSLRTCLLNLWPRLQDGSNLFTHEAPHREIAGAFFDEGWWQTQLRCQAPGLVGAGCGIGLLPADGGFRSDLGFTVKTPLVQKFRTNPQTGEQ